MDPLRLEAADVEQLSNLSETNSAELVHSSYRNVITANKTTRATVVLIICGMITFIVYLNTPTLYQGTIMQLDGLQGFGTKVTTNRGSSSTSNSKVNNPKSTSSSEGNVNTNMNGQSLTNTDENSKNGQELSTAKSLSSSSSSSSTVTVGFDVPVESEENIDKSIDTSVSYAIFESFDRVDSTPATLEESTSTLPEIKSETSDTSFGSTNTALRPNIVFILADDLGYNSLSDEVSPFMYKMAKKGVKLENYYSQEACTPARASLLTGRLPLSLGLQYYEHSIDESGGLSLEETTLADVLVEAGYVTYMLGKWNLGNESPRYLPTGRGFNYFLGYLDGFNNYWSKATPDLPEFRDFMFSDSQCYYAYDGLDVNTYSTTLYQDKAVNIIKAHDYSNPMFMYLAFQAVHDPFSGKILSFMQYYKMVLYGIIVLCC